MPTQTSNAPEIPCFQEISGAFLYQSRKGLRPDLRPVRRFPGVLRHHAHQGVGRVAGFQIGVFLRGERQLRGPCRALHMAELGRSGHGNGAFAHEPGQRDFRHGHVMEPCQLRHALDDALVLRRSRVILAPGVLVLFKALGALARQPGQPAPGQRAVGRNGDALLPAVGNHLPLLLPEDQVCSAPAR